MKKTEWLIPWLVLAAGVAAYHNCFRNPFVFDDLAVIVEDPHIRSLWSSGASLTRSPRLLVSFSFAINYALGGLDPWGYHLVNVAIHLLAALLLFGVVRRSLEAERLRRKWTGSAPWAAGIVAMLWVAHPLQTESVTYIWQRCESLMGFFYLLTLYCVIRSNDSAHANGWVAAAVVGCALGMASKEVMVTAPVAVLLYDRVFLAGSWREVGRRRWALYAGLAGTWLVLVALMSGPASETGAWKSTWLTAYKTVPPWSYLLTQAGVIMHYLRLSSWPDRLCLDYGSGWPVARTITDALPGLIVVGGLLLMTAWAWRRRPALGFVGTWLFLILAPTSSFVPIEDLVFEHRMYLPLAAVIVLAVVGAVALLERLPERWRRFEWCAGAGALALVIAFAVLTTRRNEDYRSPLTIWQDTVAKAPLNPRAHNNWGDALLAEGRLDEAMAQYQEAVRLDPNYAVAHYNWGFVLNGRGRIEEAMAQYREALRISPDFARAHHNLGSALQGLGRIDEAIAHYQEAVRIDPTSATTHDNWGVALQELGRTDEAIAHYREALRLNPGLTSARNRLRRAEAMPR